MKTKIMLSIVVISMVSTMSSSQIFAMERGVNLKNPAIVSTLDELNNAIENSSEGDIIDVNGSIVGVANVNGKKVTITGGTLQALNITNNSEVVLENITVDASKIGVTTIVSGNPGPAIYVNNSKLIVQGDTIVQNATSVLGTSGVPGAGISVVNNSYLEINSGTIIQNNENYSNFGGSSDLGGGGGVGILDSTFVMNGGIIRNNTTGRTRLYCEGGGLLIKGESAVAIINDGTIEENKALGGGGIAIDSGLLHIKKGRIIKNYTFIAGASSLGGGGGIIIGEKLINENGPIVIIEDGAIIEENTSDYYGGGISMFKGELFLNGGSVSNNTVLTNESDGLTGGIEIINNQYVTQDLPKVYLQGNFICENNKIVNTISNIHLGTFGDSYEQNILPVIQQVGPFTGRIGVNTARSVLNKGSSDIIVNAGYDSEENMAEDKVGSNALVYSDDKNYLTQYVKDGSNHKIILGQFEVKFDARGGVLDEAYKKTFYLGQNQTVTKPTDPVFDRHKFLGWAKTPHSSDFYDFNDVVSESMTLYAIWEPQVYSVTFNGNGGEGTMSDLIHDGIEKVTLPKNIFVKEHYVFTNWNTQADGKGISVIDEGSYIAGENDSVLYAQWEKVKHDVNFNSVGGSTIRSLQVEYDSLIPIPQVPTREGYTFDGWYKDASYNTVWNFNSDKVLGDMTLYAKWIPNQYILAYHANTGIGSMSDVTFATGDKITLNKNTYKKVGFEFIGWNTQADGKGRFYTDEAVINTMLPGNITLYAQWKAQGPSMFIEIPKAITLKDDTDGYAKQTEEIKIIKNVMDEPFYPNEDIIVKTNTSILLSNDKSSDNYIVDVYKSDTSQYVDSNSALITLNVKDNAKQKDSFILKTKIDHSKTKNIYKGIMSFIIEFK